MLNHGHYYYFNYYYYYFNYYYYYYLPPEVLHIIKGEYFLKPLIPAHTREFIVGVVQCPSMLEAML